MVRIFIFGILLILFIIATVFLSFAVMIVSIDEQVHVGGIISLVMMFIASSICTSLIIKSKGRMAWVL